MQKSRISLASGLAFLLSVCSLVAVPISSVVTTHQQTEQVNGQPLYVVRLNHRYVMHNYMISGSVSLVEYSTPMELSFSHTDSRQRSTVPVLPVMADPPFY